MNYIKKKSNIGLIRSLFFLIGLLLVTSAILKAHLLLTDPFADLRAGYPKGVLWLAVFLELVLATINFSSKAYDLVRFSDRASAFENVLLAE